jgi:hypothetical protein
MVNVCALCGSAPAMTFLGQEGPLCDCCFDERISVLTGWPRLPAPPAPRTVTGPHGREHGLRFRLWRTPGGISAEAIEQVTAGEPDDGYALTVFGDHDADPALLLAQLEQRVLAETSRCYLEHDDERGWQTTGTQVAGRVRCDDNDLPDVVVDGRRLSWVDFGRAMASFDGWWFRLDFGDDVPPSTPT